MGLKFTVRYRIDISVNEDAQIMVGARTVDKIPIGDTMEMNGTREEIRDRISYEIDKAVFSLEDVYYGEE